MERRSAEEMTRLLQQREEIPYFGGEDSEEEIDAVEEAECNAHENVPFHFESVECDSWIKKEPATEEESDIPPVVEEQNFRLAHSEIESRRSNAAVTSPGAIGAAAASRTPLQSWTALISQEIIDVVLKFTNINIQRYAADQINADRASFQNIAPIELKAFVGLLYVCGVQNTNRVNVSEIWSREFGSTLCKATMSQQRFEFISRRLRFDDKNTRDARRAADALAPIREIWDIFVRNCAENYSPGRFLTIDEQLLGFRGSFPARVRMESKLGRCGIKIVSLHDAETHYMCDAAPYVGRIAKPPGESIPSYYLRTLGETTRYADRNIGWKRGADVFDRLCGNFTCARTSRRWPMRFFLGMLDQAGVNGCILYNLNPDNENKNQREFLKDLALSLVKPYLQERATKIGLHKSLANSIREILSPDEIEEPTLATGKLEKRKRCYYCKVQRDRKTQYCCVKCKKAVCEGHRLACCAQCVG